MSEIDFAGLMEEPPNGENHGFKRTEEQTYDDRHQRWSRIWTPLGEETKIPPRLPEPSDHGTLTKYFNRGCRCDECRRAAREWKRGRRAHNV